MLRSLRHPVKGLAASVNHRAIHTAFTPYGRLQSRKPRIVVLGSGWSAYSFLRGLDSSKYDAICISPRDHMLFTPLLASTTVGTLEHRSVIEPVRPLLADKNFQYFQASATKVDLQGKTVQISTMFQRPDSLGPSSHITVPYDYLVCAMGAVPGTFGVPGVYENAFFLKEATDSQKIRKRLHDCFETAALPPVDLPPTATRAEREHAKKLYNDEIKRLLTFVVVGGGPTGVEFLGELHDLLDESFTRLYPHLQGKPRLKLYEASGSVLSAFDRSLRDYALRSLVDEHTEVRLGSAVKSVEPTAVVLHTGERIPCGLVVWSTGVGPNAFLKSSTLSLSTQGRHLATDAHLRVLNGRGYVYALGDAATVEAPVPAPLPSIAQVAEQQGQYLAKVFNAREVTPLSSPLETPTITVTSSSSSSTSTSASSSSSSSASPSSSLLPPVNATPFQFRSRGMLAYLGGYKGVADVIGPQPPIVNTTKASVARREQADVSSNNQGWRAWLPKRFVPTELSMKDAFSASRVITGAAATAAPTTATPAVKAVTGAPAEDGSDLPTPVPAGPTVAGAGAGTPGPWPGIPARASSSDSPNTEPFEPNKVVVAAANRAWAKPGSLPGLDSPLHMRLRGFAAWIVWRAGYLTKLGSWRNKLQVPIDWLKTFVIGRDPSSL